MVTVNINSEYSITGSNKGVLYGLSSERDGTLTDAKIRPKLRNGFEYREMDTQKTYLYDEATNQWRYWKTESDGGGGGGDVPIATDAEVDEALDDLFAGHH